MKIIWSDLAEKSYYDNLLYLNQNWPLAVVQDFILEVEKTLDLLQENPDIFKWWQSDKKYKVGHITQHISFFYNVDEEIIRIHLFWDNRQDPKKLKIYLSLT